MTTSSFESFPRPLKKQVINGVTHFYTDFDSKFETIDDCVKHLLDYQENISEIDYKLVYQYIQDHEYLLNTRLHKKLPMSEVYNNFREYVFSEISFNLRKYKVSKYLKISKQQTFLDYLSAKSMLDVIAKAKSWEGLSCKTVIYWMLSRKETVPVLKRLWYKFVYRMNVNA